MYGYDLESFMAATGSSEEQVQESAAQAAREIIAMKAIADAEDLNVCLLYTSKAALNYGFNFIPKVFSMDAYVYIMRQRNMIFRAYAITIFTTVIGTGAGLVITALLGYGLTKDIPGKRFFDFFVVFTMLFHGGLVPTYLIYTKYLHLSLIHISGSIMRTGSAWTRLWGAIRDPAGRIL